MVSDEYLTTSIIPDKLSGSTFKLTWRVLKVLGTVPSSIKKQGAKTYVVECDHCSQDWITYPEGSIITTITALRKGVLPCGCARSTYKPSNYHKRLQVSKILQKSLKPKGIRFHVDEDKIVRKTTVTIYHESNPDVRVNISLPNLTKRGDFDNLVSDCGKEVFSINPSKDSFRLVPRGLKILNIGSSELCKGWWEQYKKPSHTLLWGDYKKNTVSYYCEDCNNTPLFQYMNFNPIFTTGMCTYRESTYSCWCTNFKGFKYELPEDLILAYFQYHLKGLGVVESVEGYGNVDFFTRGRVNWVCRCGANRSQVVLDFTQGYRCKCSRSNIRDRRNYLYLLSLDEKYLKVGISVDVHSRVQKLKASYPEVKVLGYVEGNYTKISTLEQTLLSTTRNFNDLHPAKLDGYTETFPKEYQKIVEEIIYDSGHIMCRFEW